MHRIQFYCKSTVRILLPNQSLPPKFNINGFNFYDDNSFMHASVGMWAYEDLHFCVILMIFMVIFSYLHKKNNAYKEFSHLMELKKQF